MKIKNEWRRAVVDAVIAAEGARTPSMYIDIAVETVAPLIAQEVIEACVHAVFLSDGQTLGEISDDVRLEVPKLLGVEE